MNHFINISLDCTNAILIFLFYQILLKRRSSVNSFIIIGFLCLLQILCDYGISSFLANITISHTVARSAISIITNFLSALFFSNSISHKIWAAISYFAITYLSENIAYYVITFTYLSKVSYGDNLNALSISITLITNMLLFCFTMFLKVFWKSSREIQSKKYAFLLLITPLLSLGLSFYPSIFELTFTNSRTYFYLIIFLLWINILNYIFICHITKGEQLKNENQLLTDQICYQKQKYEQLGAAYRNVRSFMHDTKKHLFYIEKCVTEERYSEIIPYSKEMVQNLESRYCSINTGNLVIDAFISNLLLQTQKSGISLSTNLKIDHNLIPVNDYHLTIILGNLLDNALNACQGQSDGKINISIQTIEDTFTIHITNTTLPNMSAYNTSNSDELDLIHGYGLKNIHTSVEHYHGIAVVQEDNEIYSVTIIIPTEE